MYSEEVKMPGQAAASNAFRKIKPHPPNRTQISKRPTVFVGEGALALPHFGPPFAVIATRGRHQIAKNDKRHPSNLFRVGETSTYCFQSLTRNSNCTHVSGRTLRVEPPAR